MSLAALLMGVANRASDVNRRNEKRQYDEELAGKQAQSQYLMQQIADPSLPDEERQAYEDSFEKLHKLPGGIVSFGRQMHPHLNKLVQQHAPQLAPSVEQQQMPSAPATPAPAATEPVAGGVGRLGNVPAIPTNEQQPLQALPQATPTLGMPPSPPPSMQEPDTELGRRHLRANKELSEHLGWIDSLPIPEELKSLVKAHAAGLPPGVEGAMITGQSRRDVAEMTNASKERIAQQNLKQGNGPVYEYQPETGPAVPVRQIKGGGWMDAVSGNPYTPKTGDILTHVGDKTKWFIGSDLQPRAISEKAIQTRQQRTGTSSATLGFQVQPRPAASATPEMSDTEAQFWAKQMQTAEDLKALNPKGRAKVMSVKAAGGEGLERELTPAGKQSLEKIEPVIGQMDMLINKLEPFKGNNSSFYLAGPMLKYKLGKLTPEGELGSNISSLELAKILGAMPYIKGRPNQVFIDAIWKHLPNATIDSPMLIHDKLLKAKRLLEAYRDSAMKYDVKGAPAPSADDLKAAELTVADIEKGGSSSNKEDVKRRLKEKYAK